MKEGAARETHVNEVKEQKVALLLRLEISLWSSTIEGGSWKYLFEDDKLNQRWTPRQFKPWLRPLPGFSIAAKVAMLFICCVRPSIWFSGRRLLRRSWKSCGCGWECAKNLSWSRWNRFLKRGTGIVKNSSGGSGPCATSSKKNSIMPLGIGIYTNRKKRT